MWNLKSINSQCEIAKQLEDQLLLENKIKFAKPRIDSKQPWAPAHSISKNDNKYKR